LCYLCYYSEFCESLPSRPRRRRRKRRRFRRRHVADSPLLRDAVTNFRRGRRFSFRNRFGFAYHGGELLVIKTASFSHRKPHQPRDGHVVHVHVARAEHVPDVALRRRVRGDERVHHETRGRPVHRGSRGQKRLREFRGCNGFRNGFRTTRVRSRPG
jgi:hypothetical protein